MKFFSRARVVGKILTRGGLGRNVFMRDVKRVESEARVFRVDWIRWKAFASSVDYEERLYESSRIRCESS